MIDVELKRAQIWGQVFEIAVKRGVLAYLFQTQQLQPTHPQLSDWQNFKISQLKKQIFQALKQTKFPIHDLYLQEWIAEYFRHLLVLGYGLGWTTMRECLQKSQPSRGMELEAIWCPLTIPGTPDPTESEREKTAKQFEAAFKIQEFMSQQLLFQGKPGNSDFFLWLVPNEAQKLKGRKLDHLMICLEFSYHAPLEPKDFRLESSHCQEVTRHARYLENRGTFSRICAEVQDDQLQISSKLSEHLTAFSGEDKPLYKLCQACSYAEQLVDLLTRQNCLKDDALVVSMAITSNGVETLSAHFNGESNPSVKLMKNLGAAYQRMNKAKDDLELQQEIKIVFNKLLNSLPYLLKKELKNYSKNLPDFREDFQISATEKVANFYQPMQPLETSQILGAIAETEPLTAYFSGSPRTAILPYLNSPSLPLRDIHKAVIRAGLESAQLGRLNVIALEGNPGIGKTSSVISFLQEQSQGFLFFYASPRVVINRSVTQDLAHHQGQKTGILTLTTNSQLIKAAKYYWEKQQREQEIKSPEFDSLIVVDGVENLTKPLNTSIGFIDPKAEQDIDQKFARSQRYKQSLNQRDERVKSHKNPGVLRTLATGTRYLLAENPQINQLVLTAATQGYRKLQKTTTIDALSQLFNYRWNTKPGRNERENFAQRVPTIIAMIDEVTGDGAGALFVHAITQWLQEQFLDPFGNSPSPFRLILIIADASLSNEIVLKNFLESNQGNLDQRVPDKVLISPSRGDEPFHVTGTELKVGRGKHPTLHIMTNSFPATSLTIDYRIYCKSIEPELNAQGIAKTIRTLIREESESFLLQNAYQEIKRGYENQAKQIIFFVQDKAFLRQLREQLIEGNSALLSPDLVKILDQNVPPHERLELVQEPQRDRVRVFLMTSSGARGVSFPKADWIIASFPRFNIESSLMEIAQLIYRGRGQYHHPETGEKCSGETIPRRIVLLINDFWVKDASFDVQRQWLRQSSDLLTLLLMLRSTIYTRICGDAGLDKQRLAFVPVGGIGDDDLVWLISEDIQGFLREANVLIYDDCPEDMKQKVARAKNLVEKLFKNFDLMGMKSPTKNPQKSDQSYVNYQAIEGFVKAVSRPSSFLLPNLSEPALHIPDHLSCWGPFWWESWAARNTQERYTVFDSEPQISQERKDLIGLLKQIRKDERLPNQLRRCAADVAKILAREVEQESREFSLWQEIQSNTVMIALPLDYPQFLPKYLTSDYRVRQLKLEDSVAWRNALGRTLTPQGMILPVIAEYKDFPWAAIKPSSSISQLELAFDNRYFMASSELNLLNMILLEDHKE